VGNCRDFPVEDGTPNPFSYTLAFSKPKEAKPKKKPVADLVSNGLKIFSKPEITILIVL
jgi:hypothetical protein